MRIALLTVALLLFSTTFSHAQEPTLTEEPIATPTAIYQLPHPGILPDNPLYKLKTLRDKIILFTIRDQFKRAEKHLSLADRQLFEALKLAEKENMSLAIHTAFKGEHHMTELVDAIKTSVYEGNELNADFVDKAHRASQKHQELLEGILSRAETEEHKSSISTIVEFSVRNNNELLNLEIELSEDDPDQEQTEPTLSEEE